MVKGNNVLPNAHFHKWWQRHVRTWFNQPGRKKTRRIARQEKVAKNGSRPLGLLRPAVHPPTQRYNMKLREGRGFTLEEIKAAGISKKGARTVGIAVDHRRRNKCVESLTLNTDRIKQYLSRLVVFPRQGQKARKGFGGVPDDTILSSVSEKIVAASSSIARLFPLPKTDMTVDFRTITSVEKNCNAFETLKKARKPPKDDAEK